MILGYGSTTLTSHDVVIKFFHYAINDDLSIIEAYYLATKEAHPSSVIGAVICDTYEQLNDHLYGHGTVYPDESPNDNYYWYWTWEC